MARRISILALGTLGSVSPLAALGRTLAQQGYLVSIAAPENFRTMVEGMGLEFRRCGGDFSAFMKDGTVDRLAGAQAIRQALSWRFPNTRQRAMFEGALWDAVEASTDADAIIFHPFVSIACDIAEAKGIPAILVPLAFMAPSAEAPLSVLPGENRPRWNRYSYSLLRLQRTGFSKTVNEIRASLGLPKAPRYKHPHMIGEARVPAMLPVSPVLHPGVLDAKDGVHLTGYWHLDDAPHWRPTGRLAEFLAASPQPIYIGFGSMTGLDERRLALLLRACEATGTRAVLGEGWGSFTDALRHVDARNFHVLSYAPHHHLFKDVAAVVHHGGLGTLSTGLRAGRPTLVCPFMLDQNYWGHRVQALGVGPRPLAIKNWTDASLQDALRDLVSNASYLRNARTAQAAMQLEDGLANAALVVRRIAGDPGARHTELDQAFA